MANKTLEQLAKTYLFDTATNTTAFTQTLNTASDKAYICRGAACQNAATQDDLEKQIANYLPQDKIAQTTCLGRCHTNKAFHYKNRNYSALSAGELIALFDKQQTLGKIDSYHVSFLGAQVLTKNYGQLSDLEKLYNKTIALDQTAIQNEIKVSALRERNSNGQEVAPILMKQDKVFYCQTQKETASTYSDRFVLEQQPHLLLLGIIIAGKASGAHKAQLNIRGQYPESVTIIQDKINELRSIGWLGATSSQNGFAFDIELTQQAIVDSPLSLDVETTANLPYIIQNGGESFSKIGTSKSKGTKLVSFDSSFYVPGVYEVEMGTPFPVIIHKLAGGFKEPLQALHIGGLEGGVLPTHLLKLLTLDFETLEKNGFALGHGGIISIPDKRPILAYLKNVVEVQGDSLAVDELASLLAQVLKHFEEEILTFLS